MFGIRIISKSKLNELKAAAAVAMAIVPTETAKAVLALKQTKIGEAVAIDIEAMSSKSMTGAEKFEAVLSNTIPLVVEFLTDGGLNAALDEVEDIGRALVQSIFNDFKWNAAGKLAKAILRLVGLG
ncbi:hypothetical protein NUH86_01825 [Sphingobium sp. JS3065]|uniref:hypothetical protein n=1 Tax=Sphingobium sp. JS3065 TaxID=2970925 RepID=UPI002265451E|nr:hypothetical protein [Sphingobium sp. JS3065]UZW55570.1 hypothetical protein NUH86_01825 [Sphingobium sp. JS3065]